MSFRRATFSAPSRLLYKRKRERDVLVTCFNVRVVDFQALTNRRFSNHFTHSFKKKKFFIAPLFLCKIYKKKRWERATTRQIKHIIIFYSILLNSFDNILKRKSLGILLSEEHSSTCDALSPESTKYERTFYHHFQERALVRLLIFLTN